MLLKLLAGTSLFSALKQRMKASVRRVAVTLGLLLVAAFFFALAVLYLVHAFYIWLAGEMDSAIAALITAGGVALIGLLVLAIVALTRPRRKTPAPASALGQTAGQFGQTIGLAAATRLFGIARRMSPRMMVIGAGIAATVLAASLVRGRRDERRGD